MLGKNALNKKNPPGSVTPSERRAETENTLTRTLTQRSLKITRQNLMKLPDEGDYEAVIGKISIHEMPHGRFGPWDKVTIPFIIKGPENGPDMTVNYHANCSLDPSSRLFSLLEKLLPEIEGDVDLAVLEGLKVWVRIVHRVDEQRKVWANVDTVWKANEQCPDESEDYEAMM